MSNHNPHAHPPPHGQPQKTHRISKRVAEAVSRLIEAHRESETVELEVRLWMLKNDRSFLPGVPKQFFDFVVGTLQQHFKNSVTSTMQDRIYPGGLRITTFPDGSQPPVYLRKEKGGQATNIDVHVYNLLEPPWGANALAQLRISLTDEIPTEAPPPDSLPAPDLIRLKQRRSFEMSGKYKLEATEVRSGIDLAAADRAEPTYEIEVELLRTPEVNKVPVPVLADSIIFKLVDLLKQHRLIYVRYPLPTVLFQIRHTPSVPFIDPDTKMVSLYLRDPQGGGGGGRGGGNDIKIKDQYIPGSHNASLIQALADKTPSSSTVELTIEMTYEPAIGEWVWFSKTNFSRAPDSPETMFVALEEMARDTLLDLKDLNLSELGHPGRGSEQQAKRQRA